MQIDEKYSTIDDVAEYFAVSISTVRNWLRQKIITPESYLKVGNTYRFKVSLVERDLRGGAGDDSEQSAIDTSNEERPNTEADLLPEPLVDSDTYQEDKASTIYLLSNPAFPFLIRLVHRYDEELGWLDVENSDPLLPANYSVSYEIGFMHGGQQIFDALCEIFRPWHFGEINRNFFLISLSDVQLAWELIDHQFIENGQDLDLVIAKQRQEFTEKYLPIEEWELPSGQFGWHVYTNRLRDIIYNINDCADYALDLVTGVEELESSETVVKTLLAAISGVTDPAYYHDDFGDGGVEDWLFLARPIKHLPPIEPNFDGNRLVSWSNTAWNLPFGWRDPFRERNF